MAPRKANTDAKKKTTGGGKKKPAPAEVVKKKRGPRGTGKRGRPVGACKTTIDSPLTPKQEAFVQEFLVDLNATAAAIRAGYSEKTAYSKGSELLGLVHVGYAIKKAQEERAKRTHVDQDFVIEQLAAVAGANIGDFLEWRGRSVTLKDSEDIPRELKALISEISETEDGYKIKLHDKLSALRTLAQHLGMLDKSRFARVRVQDETVRILKKLRKGDYTPTEAALEFDMCGIPIPESVRLMMQREKEEPDNTDDGSYSAITPEEMAARHQERLKNLQGQKEDFVPKRQAEVREMKAKMAPAKQGDTFTKGGAGGEEV